MPKHVQQSFLSFRTFTIETARLKMELFKFRATVGLAFDLTSKCISYIGFIILLLGFTDVYIRNKNLERNNRWLQGILQDSEVETRHRRDAKLDVADVIKKLETQIDGLDLRVNRSTAFAALVKTPFAALLPYLRGPMGFPGRQGEQGKEGKGGAKGKPGKTGPKGVKGEIYNHITNDTGGNTYVRWGRKECPDVQGTEIIYTGYAAGQSHDHTGGMSNTVCLHSKPSFGKFSDGANTLQYIYGTEYEVRGHAVLEEAKNNEDAPCAVCRAQKRGVQIMIPGRNLCPSGWQREYQGYLMSEHYGHKGRSSAVCVDSDAEGFPRSNADKNGNLWYTIQAACGSLPCGPYINGRELTCAVCTK